VSGLSAAAIVAAVALGVLGLLVGGGWGLVILEGGAAFLVVVFFLLNFNRGGDEDADSAD
jgi:hypothetical protein